MGPAAGGAAHHDLIENLVPFAIVALALEATARTSVLSEGASLAVLALRLTHVASCILDLGGLWTFAHQAGVVATG
jgi:uncharacterized MAPEG superfamily protein